MRSNLAVKSELKQAGRSSAASASVQMRGASHPAFVDTRPEAIAQRKHQENAAASGRTSQLRAISALMAGSAQSSGMQSLAELAGTGSTQTAQRKQLIDAQGDTQDAVQPLQRVVDEEPLQARFKPVQRAEDEELLQGKFDTPQRMEEEEPLQGKFDTVQRIEEDEPLQGKFDAVQRVEEEDFLQGQFAAPASTQLKEKPNNTGLPNQLKSGIESLSGISMDHVNVHYNSARPAQLHAHAYAQGSEIHLAPGQERHLPHEAWHVVQQAQGRVKPTMQMKENTPVNDDAGLEAEADVMGAKALGVGMQAGAVQLASANLASTRSTGLDTAQLTVSEIETDNGKKYVSDFEEANGYEFNTFESAKKIEESILKMRNANRELEQNLNKAKELAFKANEETSLIRDRAVGSLNENIKYVMEMKKSAQIGAMFEAYQVINAAVTACVDTPSYYIGQVLPNLGAVAIETYHLYETFRDTGSYAQKAVQVFGSGLTIFGNALIGYAGTVAAANNSFSEMSYGVNITSPESANRTFWDPAYTGVSNNSIITLVTGTALLFTGQAIKIYGARQIANTKKEKYDMEMQDIKDI